MSDNVSSHEDIMTSDGFTLFKGKKSGANCGNSSIRQQKQANAAKTARERSRLLLEIDHIDCDKLFEKIQNFKTTLESSGLVDVVAEKIGTALGAEKSASIVCYGIGNFIENAAPQYQFALLLAIKDRLKSRSVEIFDPIIPMCTTADVLQQLKQRFLMELCDGIKWIENNERCLRSVEGTQPVLFYMPLCSLSMYNSVIASNWSQKQLSNVVILGNTFENYGLSLQREERQRSLVHVCEDCRMELRITASGTKPTSSSQKKRNGNRKPKQKESSDANSDGKDAPATAAAETQDQNQKQSKDGPARFEGIDLLETGLHDLSLHHFLVDDEQKKKFDTLLEDESITRVVETVKRGEDLQHDPEVIVDGQFYLFVFVPPVMAYEYSVSQ